MRNACTSLISLALLGVFSGCASDLDDSAQTTSNATETSNERCLPEFIESPDASLAPGVFSPAPEFEGAGPFTRFMRVRCHPANFNYYSGYQVKRFEDLHGSPMHVIATNILPEGPYRTRSGPETLLHLHPTYVGDGVFKVDIDARELPTNPRGERIGLYVFAEFLDGDRVEEGTKTAVGTMAFKGVAGLAGRSNGCPNTMKTPLRDVYTSGQLFWHTTPAGCPALPEVTFDLEKVPSNKGWEGFGPGFTYFHRSVRVHVPEAPQKIEEWVGMKGHAMLFDTRQRGVGRGPWGGIWESWMRHLHATSVEASPEGGSILTFAVEPRGTFQTMPYSMENPAEFSFVVQYKLKGESEVRTAFQSVVMNTTQADKPVGDGRGGVGYGGGGGGVGGGGHH